jgi:hypothetical protein
VRRFRDWFGTPQPNVQICEKQAVGHFGGSGSGAVLGVPSQEPRLARRGLWIILWISLGIGVGHSQASAHSCETQAVDQVVSQFRDRLWTFPA